MISRTGTEQLVVSNAVDRAVGQIDFRDLAGQPVFFDTKFLVGDVAKEPPVVNSRYVIASLRQQMIAAGCRLVDKPNEAEIIVEARLGGLGSNQQDIIYGVPANSLLSTAASVVPMLPTIPTMPEISFGKRERQSGAAKLGVIAFRRSTGEPVWQSGTVLARSSALDTWLVGLGPFQRGTIYDGTQSAGTRLERSGHDEQQQRANRPMVAFEQEHHFLRPASSSLTRTGRVVPASDERPAPQTTPRPLGHSSPSNP